MTGVRSAPVPAVAGCVLRGKSPSGEGLDQVQQRGLVAFDTDQVVPVFLGHYELCVIALCVHRVRGHDYAFQGFSLREQRAQRFDFVGFEIDFPLRDHCTV